MSLISLQGVRKVYKSGLVKVEALRGVDLSLEEGEFIAVVGPSGSGKTTLLNIIGCIDLPTEGKVILKGEELQEKRARELALLRRNYFGFIFQTFNLIPVLTVYENVELSLNLKERLPKKVRRERVLSMLDLVGLSDVVERKPLELSGGQQQRVSIARALVKQPEFVIADEPTANLDSTTGSGIVELMRKMNEEKRTTFIFSTHDPMIMKYAGKVIELRDGRIVGV